MPYIQLLAGNSYCSALPLLSNGQIGAAHSQSKTLVSGKVHLCLKLMADGERKEKKEKEKEKSCLSHSKLNIQPEPYEQEHQLRWEGAIPASDSINLRC